MTKIYPVIMCGGAGTRLWPLSRNAKAKQYHALTGSDTMLQDTIKRVQQGSKHDIAAPSFVCADRDAKVIERQSEAINAPFFTIIREPVGRNTAPLAAIIALLFEGKDPDGLVLLLPADHSIASPEEFWRCIDKGVGAAQRDYLVTLGIAPDHPETGYGYIKHGDAIDSDVYRVDAFVEKPNKKTAQSYLSAGNYYWNAGIFLFSPKSMISSFKKLAPEILSASKLTLAETHSENNSFCLHEKTFTQCPAISIDYAIMERADNVAIVAPVDIGWNDIGSWAQLAEISDTTTSGPGQNQVQIECDNTYVRTDGPFVATVGVDDLIVVVEDGKVLVTRKDKAQDVKKIVEYLKSEDRDDLC